MDNATKKQMVDFINAHCRVQEKKIPKSHLNQLSKDQLLTLIRSNPNIATAFQTYLERERTATKKSSPSSVRKGHPVTDQISEEHTQQLETLVAALKNDPTSFLAILEFKSFIEKLPYGSVSYETLSRLTDEIMDKDPSTAYLLLEYSTDQELYMQKKRQ